MPRSCAWGAAAGPSCCGCCCDAPLQAAAAHRRPCMCRRSHPLRPARAAHAVRPSAILTLLMRWSSSYPDCRITCEKHTAARSCSRCSRALRCLARRRLLLPARCSGRSRSRLRWQQQPMLQQRPGGGSALLAAAAPPRARRTSAAVASSLCLSACWSSRLSFSGSCSGGGGGGGREAAGALRAARPICC